VEGCRVCWWAASDTPTGAAYRERWGVARAVGGEGEAAPLKPRLSIDQLARINRCKERKARGLPCQEPPGGDTPG
jgi:hypothetical protein